MKEIFKKYTIGIRQKGEDFIYLKPPFYEFWADPFIVKEKGKIYIFFEIYNFFRRKGHIAVATYNVNKKKLYNKKTILKDRYHFSYPHIIKYCNKYYLIPETYQNEKISLYEFIDFPYNIRLKQHLIEDINTVDTTLLIENENVYLFTNTADKNKKNYDESLNIFHANTLYGPYVKLNKFNIDKYDKSNLRMAGNIIFRDGKKYRISQNCSKVYGENMNLNEIIHISKDYYLEKYAGKFKLEVSGLHHTFNEIDDYEVIDIVKTTNIFFFLFVFICIIPINVFLKFKRKVIKTR